MSFDKNNLSQTSHDKTQGKVGSVYEETPDQVSTSSQNYILARRAVTREEPAQCKTLIQIKP